MFLGIIPARSGSRGLKNKNMLTVNGKSLIARAVEAALGSASLDDHVVTTDSDAYVAEAMDAGGNAPFIRPAELASDTASTVDVLRHALTWYEDENKTKVDAVVLLQPTTPLRNSTDVDAAIRVFNSSAAADSLITCYKNGAAHPAITYTLEDGAGKPLMSGKYQGTRRQDFPDVYVRNGAIYICTRNLLMDDGRIMGDSPLIHTMPYARSINVDSRLDLEIARTIANKPELADD